MGKHATPDVRGGWHRTAAVLLVVAGLAVTGLVGLQRRGGTDVASQTGPICDRTVRVLTASSFAPVLAELAPSLGAADECLRVEVTQADGRAAAARVPGSGVDVWIPDDAAWADRVPEQELAPSGVLGAGAVVATSPIFMVTDSATAARVQKAGGSWLALAGLLGTASGTRLVVSDPATSGDGMVAAGSVGEAVWIAEGMDASSLALGKAVTVTRTVSRTTPALPRRAGEVGLVPEYALLPHLDGPAARAALLTGSDRTAILRYTWLPTAAAAADPGRAAALETLRRALTGRESPRALAAAGLRGPVGTTPPGAAAGRVPDVAAEAFPVLGRHHVDHVLATWYRTERRMSLTAVVDVSGSMAARAPGSGSPLIDLVRAGCLTVAQMLPDDARLGLWEFGSRLDGPRDHRRLLPLSALTPAHRRSLTSAVDRLRARRTGTGLHDTILAAYVAARDEYRPGTSNQVLVFTDGRNEKDPGGISLQELTRRITRAQDPRRPVKLSVVVFGQRPETERLAKALEPVRAYVQSLETAQDVEAMFVHVAAGGLHS